MYLCNTRHRKWGVWRRALKLTNLPANKAIWGGWPPRPRGGRNSGFPGPPRDPLLYGGCPGSHASRRGWNLADFRGFSGIFREFSVSDPRFSGLQICTFKLQCLLVGKGIWGHFETLTTGPQIYTFKLSSCTGDVVFCVLFEDLTTSPQIYTCTKQHHTGGSVFCTHFHTILGHFRDFRGVTYPIYTDFGGRPPRLQPRTRGPQTPIGANSASKNADWPYLGVGGGTTPPYPFYYPKRLHGRSKDLVWRKFRCQRRGFSLLGGSGGYPPPCVLYSG